MSDWQWIKYQLLAIFRPEKIDAYLNALASKKP